MQEFIEQNGLSPEGHEILTPEVFSKGGDIGLNSVLLMSTMERTCMGIIQKEIPQQTQTTTPHKQYLFLN